MAGPQAAYKLSHQITPECHRKHIQSDFKLTDVSLRQNTQQLLTLRSVKASNCLKQGATLKAILETTTKDTKPLKPGFIYRISGRLKAPYAPLQLNGFDVQNHWFKNSINGHINLKKPPFLVNNSPYAELSFLSAYRFNTSMWLNKTLNNNPSKGIVIGLVTGDTGLINPSTRDLYNQTGIAHLIAISGFHITMLAYFAGMVSSHFWRKSHSCLRFSTPQTIGAFIGLLVALIYGVMTGWAVPAQRTLIMLTVLALSKLSSAKMNPWNIFGLAMLVTAWSNPWVIFDTGFILSFGAVAILIFANHNRNAIASPLSQLAQAGYSQYAITIGFIPVTATLFNQQHWISPLTNALSIPWMSFLSTPLAIAGAILRQDWLTHLAAWSLNIQGHWLTYFNQLPNANLAISTPSALLFLIASFGAFILLLPTGIAPKTFGIALLGCLLLPANTPETGDFWIDVHDVGQGNAISIRTQNHHLLFDTGKAFTEQSSTGRRVLVPFYHQLGVQQLDQLWLSHNDNDHTGGAKHVMKILKVKHVFASFKQADSNLKNTPVEQWENCHHSKPWVWDGVYFEPLKLSDLTTKNDNNRSCVLKVSNKTHSLLLTGDIEKQSEQELIKNNAHKLKVDILLVPHHGSKTSSTRHFLQAVNPTLAIVQAGWKNNYGHPHPNVEQRLKRFGAHVLNTANLGAILIKTDKKNKRLTIKTAYSERFAYWHYQKRETKTH